MEGSMGMELPTFADVIRAQKRLRPYLPPTPLHHYPGLDQIVGAEVYVKHENYQPIGAFKVRGGLNYIAQLSPEERRRGVLTASTGNHGQSIAYAAGIFGARAVIVAPENANPIKVAAMRGYGAEVVLFGPDFEACKRHAHTLAEEQGLRFISSGDEPLLIAGVATHTLEILEAQPEIDVVIAPRRAPAWPPRASTRRLR
jgi:threonine dehydratase